MKWQIARWIFWTLVGIVLIFFVKAHSAPALGVLIIVSQLLDMESFSRKLDIELLDAKIKLLKLQLLQLTSMEPKDKQPSDHSN